MSIVLALLVLTGGALAAVAFHLRRAPEGYEDGTGFHFSSSENTPFTGDSDLPLAMGTDPRVAQFGVQSSRRKDNPDSIRIPVPQVREAH